MLVYSYNCPTNEYIGTEEAQEDPLHPGEYLMPAKSTTIEPPLLEEYQVAVFENGDWVVYPDYRNNWQVHLPSKQVSVIDYIGDIQEEYQLLPSSEIANDIILYPENYKVIDGKLQSIVGTEEWEAMDTAKRKAVLVEDNYLLKEAKAYGGIYINYQNMQLLFETKTESIVNTTATLGIMSDEDTVNWKFYSNDIPVSVPLTKTQLGVIAKFGLNMINECFSIEGDANAKVYAASRTEVTDDVWVASFKAKVEEAMNAVPNTIDFEDLQK